MSSNIAYARGGEKKTRATVKPETTVTPIITPTEAPQVIATPVPTEEITQGTPFSTEGNTFTRDLLYDKATNKQFLTIQTRNGKVFYLVVDYDKPVDDKEEQYQTYFLNLVDERDMEDLLKEETENTPIVCICTEKCEPGKVNAECPLCAQDIKKCVGKVATATPSPSTKPVVADEQTKEKSKGSSFLYLVILLVLLLAGGGIALYL